MEERLIRFLLVEDDENHARIMLRNMAKHGVNNIIDHVEDGELALQFLMKEGKYKDVLTPDVILLDLNIPKINGHQVLERIKTNEILKTIPVVILTTSNADKDREKAYAHQANSYVTKPVDFEKLKQLAKDLSLFWGTWNEPPSCVKINKSTD